MPIQQRYEEVAADLRRRIEAGEFEPTGQLPSRTQMREIYNISDSVSDKALFILRQAGLVETLAGVGVFRVARPEG